MKALKTFSSVGNVDAREIVSSQPLLISESPFVPRFQFLDSFFFKDPLHC
ncbi:hypothetical protein RISK_002116 [Rhodopirellula islandica]|uniref:Uncharacterized protein n=1 Tax=Rhodopirellula islandica TaxID=595434 RepID=A0A0J1EIZ1_RHOIS|nr:hypothetical protein RISK_002116 [Rhodopirellula islandica]